MQHSMFSTAETAERAVLVSVIYKQQSEEKAQEYLDELDFLATTAGVLTVKRFTQKLDHPDHRTFVGKGKLAEIVAFVNDQNIDVIIFDDDLSTSQTRNLDEALGKKVIDRSLLILQIFMQRAKTAQSRTQVELAQYEYMLPRLTRLWTHLSRQKGGIGLRGPGESELETDRRIVKDRISFLKEKLETIEKQGVTRRKSREQMVRIALVGYTNVGKSTLMNLLSKSDVFAENKLFATVDATVRKIVLQQVPFLLSDTVGFIRKLPTMLIESFKSTLAEIVEADILMQVVDVSHSAFEEHLEVVNKTLQEIGASDKPMILVFNKVDLYKNPDLENPEETRPTLEQLKNSFLGKNAQTVFISATSRQNIDELRALMVEEAKKVYYRIYPNYLENLHIYE